MTDRRPDPADRTPTSNPVLRKALAWGGALAAVVLVVGSVVAGGSVVASTVDPGAVVATVDTPGVGAVSVPSVAHATSSSVSNAATTGRPLMGGTLCPFAGRR